MEIDIATATITVGGGFHNSSPITLRLRNGAMSAGQYKRLQNHLCGISGCICGGRGIEISGMARDTFDAAREKASYAAHYGNR